MELEKLLKLLDAELEYLETEAYKFNNKTEEGKVLERIAQKVHFLKTIVSARSMSAKDVKNIDCAFATKETILSLFHPKTLIGELLKK